MSVGQYLQRYAEPETRLATDLQSRYQYVLIIPACLEDEPFLTRITELPCSQAVLLILVHNLPQGSTQTDTKKAISFNDIIKSRYPVLAELDSSTSLHSIRTNPEHHLLLIDKTQSGHQLPSDQGVGLARKIGCDLACQLIHDGLISQPWIFTTDADVTLPPQYFESCLQLNTETVAAAIFPFRHMLTGNTVIDQCQLLYDMSLKHYQEGLARAASPYAFFTLGSTLVLNYQSYSSVRGFVKKSAGEDFYLLNKLAKVGHIVSLPAPVLEIETRLSDRVPFGTGPALRQIMSLEKAVNDYTYYHPETFTLLKIFLEMFPLFWETGNKLPDPDYQLIMTSVLDSINIDACAPLLNVMKRLSVDKALEHAITHSYHLDTYMRHMHNWFDGFRTLKFIHALREEGFANLNICNLLKYKDNISDELYAQFAGLKR